MCCRCCRLPTSSCEKSKKAANGYAHTHIYEK
nr:MAG TPA: hypothetical protein [Caudoviricetes sp.]